MSKPKIWQRGQTGSFYTTINGEQVRLGKTEEEAKERYDYLMGVAGRQSIGRVDDLLDAFLEWVKINRSEETYRVYREQIQGFNKTIPGLRICDLKPFHVNRWLDGQPLHYVADAIRRPVLPATIAEDISRLVGQYCAQVSTQVTAPPNEIEASIEPKFPLEEFPNQSATVVNA